LADPVAVKLARPAMATFFELLLWGEDRDYLRSVGEEALDEIEWLEQQLSLFIPTSEVAAVNVRAGQGPVRVGVELFQLLRHAADLTVRTGGAFDVTAGLLSECWGFHVGQVRIPVDAELQGVLDLVGMAKVLLSDDERTVRFERDGMFIDLGGIGKGSAVERAAGTIREYDIGGALVHGGTSTIYGVGTPPDRDAWPIGILHPLEPDRRLGCVRLCDQALSTSKGSGRSVRIDGEQYGHLIDPRTGRPANGLLSAAAICPSPTEADALSTAFAILGIEETEDYCDRHPGVGAIVMFRPDNDGPVRTKVIGAVAEEAYSELEPAHL